MKMKDTLSSCSNSEEQQIQQIQDKAKKRCLTTEEKVDTSKALDASLVDKVSSGTKSKEQDTSSRSGNDAHADDADMRPIYNEEPMVEKYVFNANHDTYVTKFLNEVNSRAKVPSNKTTNKIKPVEQISVAKKPERQISKGHRFLIKKTFVVHEKIMTPRSCLKWKPTGKIFKTVSLKWVPTGKIFTCSTTKVDNEPTNSSNKDITNQCEYEQTLDVSADTTISSQQELDLLFGPLYNEFFTADCNSDPNDKGECTFQINDHNNELSSSKLFPEVVPSADTTVSSQQELDLLFGPLYNEFLTAGKFMPPKPDLSYTGLVEFVDKLVAKNTKSCDEETKASRKNSDAPIIKECVSDDEDENVAQPKIVKKIVRPIIVMKEFVKPRQQEKPTRKIVKKVKHNRKNTHRPRCNQIN
nr:hypothetical protein [Tanacetum cinerariifolium]